MSLECPNITENNETCPCKALDCERHGKCCACVRNHAANKNYPACLRYD